MTAELSENTSIVKPLMEPTQKIGIFLLGFSVKNISFCYLTGNQNSNRKITANISFHAKNKPKKQLCQHFK